MDKFRIKNQTKRCVGQTAMEYLILLGIMTVIALMAFQTTLPDVLVRTNGHFNIAAGAIIGDLPQTSIGGPFP